MKSLWAVPIVIALLSGIGLVSALLADGVWDALSWFGLGFPIAVSAWFALRRGEAVN